MDTRLDTRSRWNGKAPSGALADRAEEESEEHQESICALALADCQQRRWTCQTYVQRLLAGFAPLERQRIPGGLGKPETLTASGFFQAVRATLEPLHPPLGISALPLSASQLRGAPVGADVDPSSPADRVSDVAPATTVGVSTPGSLADALAWLTPDPPTLARADAFAPVSPLSPLAPLSATGASGAAMCQVKDEPGHQKADEEPTASRGIEQTEAGEEYSAFREAAWLLTHALEQALEQQHCQCLRVASAVALQPPYSTHEARDAVLMCMLDGAASWLGMTTEQAIIRWGEFETAFSLQAFSEAPSGECEANGESLDIPVDERLDWWRQAQVGRRLARAGQVVQGEWAADSLTAQQIMLQQVMADGRLIVSPVLIQSIWREYAGGSAPVYPLGARSQWYRAWGVCAPLGRKRE